MRKIVDVLMLKLGYVRRHQLDKMYCLFEDQVWHSAYHQYCVDAYMRLWLEVEPSGIWFDRQCVISSGAAEAAKISANEYRKIWESKGIDAI